MHIVQITSFLLLTVLAHTTTAVSQIDEKQKQNQEDVPLADQASQLKQNARTVPTLVYQTVSGENKLPVKVAQNGSYEPDWWQESQQLEEMRRELELMSEERDNWVNPQLPAQYGNSIEDDQSYRYFSGISETIHVWSDKMTRWREAYCRELAQAVENFASLDVNWPIYQGKRERPAEFGVLTHLSSNDSKRAFQDLMWHALAPEDMRLGNKYAAMTGWYEDQLKSKILSSSRRLTPADLLQLALSVTKGNYRLAVLVTHNLLKNVTYKGRNHANKIRGIYQRKQPQFPPQYGAIASRLVNLRATPQEGIGRTDKMGPWYHAFVVLSIAAWTDDPHNSRKAILGENTYRVTKREFGAILGDMGSPVDREKQISDLCFQNAAERIHAFLARQKPATTVRSSPGPNSAPPDKMYAGFCEDTGEPRPLIISDKYLTGCSWSNNAAGCNSIKGCRWVCKWIDRPTGFFSANQCN